MRKLALESSKYSSITCFLEGSYLVESFCTSLFIESELYKIGVIYFFFIGLKSFVFGGKVLDKGSLTGV
jgi:hypothetical protein